MVLSMAFPSRARASSRALAWSTLRGKPSSAKPWAASGRAMRSRSMPTVNSSGTRSPCPPPLADEPFVLAHEELGLDLAHGVEDDADDDDEAAGGDAESGRAA